jgi:hypothetical protein
MQALKTLVIGMGILIVCAILLLGYGLYKRTVEPEWRLFGPQTSPTNAENVPNSFGDISLGLRPGCRIVDVSANGPRAFILTGTTDDCAEVIVIDVRNGKILGRLGH